MFALLRSKRLLRLIAALYALAMLTLGFAHVAVAAPAVPAGVQLSLPDGSLLSLCLNEGTDGVATQVHCEACVLTSAPGLGAVALPAVSLPDFVVLAVLSPADDAVPASYLIQPKARGPPLG